MKADRVAGAAVAAFGAALGVLAAQIDVLVGGPAVDARFFPFILAGVLLIGGAALALRPGDTPIETVTARLLDRRALLFAGLFLAYALSFRHVDFRLGTWAFALAAMWALGARRPLELALIPPLLALGVFYLFRHGFTVLLPSWG